MANAPITGRPRGSFCLSTAAIYRKGWQTEWSPRTVYDVNIYVISYQIIMLTHWTYMSLLSGYHSIYVSHIRRIQVSKKFRLRNYIIWYHCTSICWPKYCLTYFIESLICHSIPESHKNVFTCNIENIYFMSAFSMLTRMYNRLLRARLQYIQCDSNGDTTVFH